jgi:hypothetical protein
LNGSSGTNASPTAMTATAMSRSSPEMKNKKENSRPSSARQRSFSKDNGAANEWAKTVQREEANEFVVAIEPLLVPRTVAAEMLGISPRSVWQLGEEGLVVTGKIGRRKNYLVSSLRDYVKRITEGK